MCCRKLFLVASLLVVVDKSYAINCYQCRGSDPTKPFQCNEWLSSDIDIEPEPCDSVYGASYCVKHVGRFEGNSISCYQCASSENMDCSDGMVHMGGIKPKSCDHVFEAQFCIKSTSLDGGIGTKRFCSSVDMGNYCNYVRQPGDSLTYRSCIFTCTGDGCNHTTIRRPNFNILLALCAGLVLLGKLWS